MIGTNKLYIFISVLMTLTFILGDSCIRNQKLCCQVSRKFRYWFGWNLVCCHNLFVEAYAKLLLLKFCSRREFCWNGFMNCTINIIMCQDTCERICFKLGMMLNTTKLYTLIPVSITLVFTQGHRVTGKLELVQSFCFKLARSNSNVHDGWLCKGDGCEEIL